MGRADAAGADEHELLKAVALQNSAAILQARRRAERELLQARDALERKTEELALALSMMKATLDSATDGILVTDEAGRVTGYNEKFVQMWALPRERLADSQHQGLLQLIAAAFESPAQLVARVEAICQEAPQESFDLLRPRDGRAIERHSRPQLVEGRRVGRVWSFRDITERCQAEDALRDETRVLELLNRTGQSLASKLDLHEVVQAVTDAGTQISGARYGAFFYNARDGQGESLQLFTLSGASRALFERFGRPRATAVFGPTFRGEALVRSADITQDPRYGRSPPHHGMPEGHLPVRSYLALPVKSRSGEMLGALLFGHPEPGVFTERSERLLLGIAAQAAVALDNANLFAAVQQSAEERKRLLESERAARNLAERMSALKDDFLATLSHELRTPLSAILGWVQILRRATARPEDHRKGIDTIERNSRLQLQLIDDLLDMNRIASGKLHLDMQPVDPIRFVEAAIETIQPAANAKKVRLEHELDPSVASVAGDPGRLQQVMCNLLSNAVKFTPEGGSVEVALSQQAGWVHIAVTDTGIGIPAGFVDHVFERFRQADSSHTRRYGGLGLGLSIVRSLVELHGGSIAAASEGAGRGARFTVRLPIAAPRHHDGAGEMDRGMTIALSPAFTPRDLSGVKVLVVDDDADGRDLVTRVLSECQAQVLSASSAAEAIRLLRTEQPHVMVSDIGMPEVDGFTLLRRVRALGVDQGGTIPVVALTAFARPEDRSRALAAGFAGHLTKPFEPAELLASVARAAAPRAGA